jgi:phenylpyruvate tautomerase PptA (4-oxalocrotonate tautomerase family)
MAAAAKKLQYASLNSTVSQNFIDDAQAQYDSAAAAINTELLQAYVNVAADLNEDIYTTKALRKINKLAENAKTLLADEDSTDEQKLAAASALKEALADTTALDTSVLSVVINEADKINLDDYADLDDTKANFTAALEAAKSTVETAEKKAEVEAAAIALNEAMMELRVKPSAETLEELKAILAQLKETDASNTDENTQAEKEDLVNEIEEAIDSPATYQLQAVKLLSRARTTIESINSYEPVEVIEDITPNELPSITDEKITIDLPEENAVSAGVENVVDSLAQAEKDVAEKVNANKEADVTSETEPIVSIDDASKVAESITAPESTDKAVNAPETETSVTADTDKAAATSTSVKTGVAAAPYLVAAGASLVALLKKRKKH